MTELIIVLGIVVMGCGVLVLPWINWSRISDLKGEMERLRATILQLRTQIEKQRKGHPESKEAPKLEQKQPHQTEQPPPLEEARPRSALRRSQTNGAWTLPPRLPKEPEIEKLWEEHPPEERPSREKAPEIGFEERFGAQLPVWLGGIALVLGGIFLVKYSVEHVYISPAMRLSLAGLLAMIFLGVGEWIRSKRDFANGVRIAQALSGAGVAVLYGVFMASTRLYDLLPGEVAFVGMAITTLLAVILSLAHGMPIALLGLVGGFLTPALIGSENPSAPGLFLYLYLLFAGLIFTIRQKHWWSLTLPALFGAFVWTFVWVGWGIKGDDGIWISLFLLAITATMAISSLRRYETVAVQDEGGAQVLWFSNFIGIVSALVVMAAVLVATGFSWVEWGFLGLLAVGCVVLAYLDAKLYKWAPMLAMAAVAFMLWIWDVPQMNDALWTVLGFAAFFMCSGAIFMWRKSQSPVLWCLLLTMSSVVYYCVGYAVFEKIDTLELPSFTWGLMAWVAAFAYAVYAYRSYIVCRGHPNRDHIFAMLVCASVAFIALGAWIEWDERYLLVVLAAEICVLSALKIRLQLHTLDKIQSVLFYGVAAVIVVSAVMCGFSALSDESIFGFRDGIRIFLVPGILLGCSAYLLLKIEDTERVRRMEGMAVICGVMAVYVLLTESRTAIETIPLLTASGLITNAFLAMGVGILYLSRMGQRQALVGYGIALVFLGLLRILLFDILSGNPLWTPVEVTGFPLLNTLIWPYGLPIVFCWAAARELYTIRRSDELVGMVYLASLALMFVWVTMNVRFVYHPHQMSGGILSNAEIYTYSCAWLGLGVTWLVAGILRADKILRVTSLILILFTVGKVFLYDASELEGLYRVFSFLGLGLCLLGISYFYTRFVFTDKDKIR